MNPSDPEEFSTVEDAQHSPGFAGRWIARVGQRIVAQGGTPQQALQAATHSRAKESIQVSYVPTARPLMFSELFERVRQTLPVEQPVFLVGGAVRDALMGIASHDLDFVLAGNPRPLARKLANTLHGAYYLLDAERNTARVILTEDGPLTFLDFASLRGASLEEDLKARDFTLNAMAVSADEPQKLLDPLGGAADLYKKILKACSPGAFMDDPLRILRGVRLAAAHTFRIEPATRGWMRQAAGELGRVSAERVRDELFKILEGPRVSAALRTLDWMRVFPILMPEVLRLKGVAQSSPHAYDVWEHTLKSIDALASLLDVLGVPFNPEKASNLFFSLAAMKLGRYREKIADHLNAALNPNRTLRGLLAFSLLFHDIAKPDTRSVEESGRIRFYDHETMGVRVTTERARQLELSNLETERLATIVRGHLRIHLLVQTGQPPTRRAVYRFFRSTGAAGIDLCLVTLADVLATYGPDLPQDTWIAYLDAIRTLFEAWWEQPAAAVEPPVWLNGNDLITEFGLSTGPLIGRLLEELREAQVEGLVSDRAAALDFIQGRLNLSSSPIDEEEE